MNPSSPTSPSSPVLRVHSPLNAACLRDDSPSLSDWQGGASLLATAVLLVGILWNTAPRLPVPGIGADVSTGFELAQPRLLTEPEIREPKVGPSDETLPTSAGPMPPLVVPGPVGEFVLPTAVPLVPTDPAVTAPGPRLSASQSEPTAQPFTSLSLKSAASLGTTPWPTTYPAEALARREEGSVQLELSVGSAGGVPTEIAVIRSSGSRYLDFAARDWVRSQWRFDSGRPGTYRVEFTYQLPVGRR